MPPTRGKGTGNEEKKEDAVTAKGGGGYQTVSRGQKGKKKVYSGQRGDLKRKFPRTKAKTTGFPAQKKSPDLKT